METKQQNWYAVEVRAETAAAEAIEFALNELEALGTEINHLGRTPAAALTVVGYFHELPAEETLRAQIDEALRIYGFAPDAVHDLATREVVNEDWLAEWKKHWKPTETARFIVEPTWETLGATDKIVIRIEPSMAFGTGTHETTRLCLKAIGEHYRAGESFLDVGTGTGILAIAAAKQSALARRPSAAPPAMLGCDTDADSITIARENAELNETPEIEFYVGSISAETPAFDFVCANLTADVILPMLALLVEKTVRVLVLSGILREQETLVTDELKRLAIDDFKVETDGEWISVTAEKQ